MMDVIRDAWPWVFLAFLLGLLCGWLATRLFYRDLPSERGFGIASTSSLDDYRLAEGARIIGGVKLRLNDLGVIEGIGPKIEKLLNRGGIRTWEELAVTQVSRLEGILNAAGSDYQMHVPGTWPQQARLLAEGRWQEFKDLTDELTGGR
jgi:hypothetical protein